MSTVGPTMNQIPGYLNKLHSCEVIFNSGKNPIMEGVFKKNFALLEKSLANTNNAEINGLLKEIAAKIKGNNYKSASKHIPVLQKLIQKLFASRKRKKPVQLRLLR